MANESVVRNERFEGFKSASPAMLRVYKEIEACVRGELRCLFLGPRGSGKEFLAKYYYREFVKRKGGGNENTPFRAMNCACLVDTLAVSQLFGHIAGAFTGAPKDAPGLFRESQGGVLFLDEIGDIPANLDAILNRALEGDAMPVGSNKPYSTKNVRVIAATEQPAGGLRPSLHDRFQVFIFVPGVDQRKEDIRPALECFFRQAVVKRREGDRHSESLLEKHRLTEMSCDVAGTLESIVLARTWPGSFRSLRNLMDFAVMSAADEDSGQFCEDVQHEFMRYLDRYSSAQDTKSQVAATPRVESGDTTMVSKVANKIVQILPRLHRDEKSQLAGFLVEQRGHFFTRDDLEREFPGLSKSTIHERLRRLRHANLITQEGPAGELYRVTLEQHPAATARPALTRFLPLPPDVTWPKGVRKDLVAIRLLLEKSRIVFVGGDPGAGKTVCVQALGTDLNHQRAVFYYPFGDRGVPWFLGIVRQELKNRGITEDLLSHEPVADETAMEVASLAAPVRRLFSQECRPVLILDNIELVSDPGQEKALIAMLRYWGESLSFLLVGKKMRSLLGSDASLPVVEYTIMGRPTSLNGG